MPVINDLKSKLAAQIEPELTQSTAKLTLKFFALKFWRNSRRLEVKCHISETILVWKIQCVIFWVYQGRKLVLWAHRLNCRLSRLPCSIAGSPIPPRVFASSSALSLNCSLSNVSTMCVMPRTPIVSIMVQYISTQPSTRWTDAWD